MIMIIIVMRFQEYLRYRLGKHDIAHIASVFLSQLGCWLFFCLQPTRFRNASVYFLVFKSNFLNREDNFLRYHPQRQRSRLCQNVEEN
ncbi:MAG TPA: hypothetical protein DEA88_00245 [Erwinia persicina]|nr:hypothetical protein [Erwinia persicina]HBH67391.1 hypothetical protein [Erwinia persicina]HBT11585.1 hypothetical protein [Erwinia persicina]HBT30999.1 hypothetical protein [Erwinia persicina]